MSSACAARRLRSRLLHRPAWLREARRLACLGLNWTAGLAGALLPPWPLPTRRGSGTPARPRPGRTLLRLEPMEPRQTAGSLLDPVANVALAGLLGAAASQQAAVNDTPDAAHAYADLTDNFTGKQAASSAVGLASASEADQFAVTDALAPPASLQTPPMPGGGGGAAATATATAAPADLFANPFADPAAGPFAAAASAPPPRSAAADAPSSSQGGGGGGHATASAGVSGSAFTPSLAGADAALPPVGSGGPPPAPNPPAVGWTDGTNATGPGRPDILQQLKLQPLHFEANRGQTDSSVQFLSVGAGSSLFLTPTGMTLSLTRPGSVTPPAARGQPAGPGTADVIQMQVVGANPSAQAEGLDLLPDTTNYFVGSDPSKWLTDIPNFGEVAYRDVYPGIDLVYHGSAAGQLEYDFVVNPGASASAIQLAFAGTQGVSLDAQGNLAVQTPEGPLTEHTPTLYQLDASGNRQAVTGRYVALAGGQIGFAAGSYDPSRPLVIDPVLNYSTYLGGDGADQGTAVAVDSLGNTYVTGQAGTVGFPTTAGAYQTSGSGAFVSKFDPSGRLVYSTLLGNTAVGNGIAVDAQGDAFLTGTESSGNNFPTTQGAFQTSSPGPISAFVTELGPLGNTLVYSTFLTGPLGYTYGNAIALDGQGLAYVAGNAFDPNFPTTSGAFQRTPHGSNPYDAFVAKFNAAGSTLVYATYLGGSGDDQAHGIAVDSSGNAVVVGDTSSTDFPTQSPVQASNAGGYDAFVTKLNSTGTGLVYSTYLGGAGDDHAYGVALDSTGSPVVTGSTASTNFPTQSPLQGANAGGTDAFVAKLTAAGTSLAFATYLGGSGNDAGQAVALDQSGNIYITGSTASTNFPTANPLQASNGGGTDAFVAGLNAAGSTLTYSTYLGGTSNDAGYGIAVDGTGYPVVVGQTYSTNFPLKNPVQSVADAGDAFVSHLGPDVSAAQLVSDPQQGDLVPFGLVNVSPQTGDLQLPVTIDYRQSCFS